MLTARAYMKTKPEAESAENEKEGEEDVESSEQNRYTWLCPARPQGARGNCRAVRTATRRDWFGLQRARSRHTNLELVHHRYSPMIHRLELATHQSILFCGESARQRPLAHELARVPYVRRAESSDLGVLVQRNRSSPLVPNQRLSGDNDLAVLGVLSWHSWAQSIY